MIEDRLKKIRMQKSVEKQKKKELEIQITKIKLLSKFQQMEEKDLEKAVKQTEKWHHKMWTTILVWIVTMIITGFTMGPFLFPIILGIESIKSLALSEIVLLCGGLSIDTLLGAMSVINYSTYRIFAGDKEDKELHLKQNAANIQIELSKLEELMSLEQNQPPEMNTERKTVTGFIPTDTLYEEPYIEAVEKGMSRVRTLEN